MDEIKSTPRPTIKRIKEYLQKGKRFDGRKLDEFRTLTLERDISNQAEGSVKVKLGKTEIIVGIKVGTATPYPDSPDKGNLIVSSELLPLSSPRFELGPPKFESIELARVIDRGIRESKVIDMEKLVIEEGEKVWTIFVDIYSINEDGNLLDVAGIGALTALKIAKLPKYDKKKRKILFWEEDKPIPLTKVNPIPITIHKIGGKLVVDPTREEEDGSETRLTVGMSDGIIHSMQKGNSATFTDKEIEEAVEIAEKVWKEVFKKVDKFISKE